MKHIKRINTEECLAVFIDYQEKLMPVMLDRERLEDKVIRFLRGIQSISMPFLFTQQYTNGLGMTIESLRSCIEDFEYIEKKSFSALGSPAFLEALSLAGKKTILLCGIESHICVMQTALDLLERDYHVFVVTDCCSSRDAHDSLIGLARIEKNGGILITMEGALMECVKGAEHQNFKTISKIIK